MPMPRTLACLAVLLATIAGSPARAAEVDLALVLAVDVSASVSEERYELQVRGYAEAFRNPRVAEAIAQGPIGAIAVTFAQWADYGAHRQVIGWTVIRDAETATRFGSAIAETARALAAGSTSISGAIDYSVRLLRTSGHQATRQVIDVSGDGINNQGPSVARARDEAVAAGITINGLVVASREGAMPGPGAAALEAHFRRDIIGGPGAFVMTADAKTGFAQAVLNKLLLEIAAR